MLQPTAAVGGHLQRSGVGGGHVEVQYEIAEIGPKEAGATAYMLSAGRGKTRAGHNGGNQPTLTWRLL